MQAYIRLINEHLELGSIRLFGLNVLINIGFGISFNTIVGLVTLLVGLSSLILNIIKIRKATKKDNDE